MTHPLVAHVRRRPNVRVFGKALEELHFISNRAVHGIGEHHCMLFARIVGASEHRKGQQRSVGNAQPRHDGRPQGLVRVIQRQAQFGQANQ